MIPKDDSNLSRIYSDFSKVDESSANKALSSNFAKRISGIIRGRHGVSIFIYVVPIPADDTTLQTGPLRNVHQEDHI